MQVSPQQFLLLAQAVKLAGGDPHPGMALAGLDDLETTNMAPWRSIADLDTMMRITQEATGDPGFGLVVATSIVHSLYGALAQLTVHAPTLRAILEDIGRYGRLLQLHKEMSYTVVDARCTLSFSPLGTTVEGRRARAEQIMGNVMMLLRYFGAQNADIQHIQFAHRRPDHGPRYAAVFGPFVRFDQPTYEIAFAAPLLDIAQPGRDPRLYGVAKASANAELAEVERGDATGVAVERLLRHSDGALPDMLQAAQRLGMSVRTLRRKLASEGHSYGQMLADHRRAVVERLLLRGDIPLKQIAISLGYASDSSFHRAFRRQAGLTPLKWRQQELKAKSTDDGPSTDVSASEPSWG